MLERYFWHLLFGNGEISISVAVLLAASKASHCAGSLLDELGDVDIGVATNIGGGLIVGDMVEVVKGNLVGMWGKLVGIDAGVADNNVTVCVAPDDASGLSRTDTVDFLTEQVRKLIAVGAHIKVTCG